MEYEIRIYHFGELREKIPNLTKQQARIEYFWNAEKEFQYTELWVDGVPKKTWEAKKILGFEGKREFHYGRETMARMAREAVRLREREEAMERARREKCRPFIAPRSKNKSEGAATNYERNTYYERNREKILEKQKAWRKNNPEKVRELNRKYRESHRKEENQRARERYAKRKAKEGGE